MYGPGLGNEPILNALNKPPKSKMKVCLNTHLYLVFLCQLLIGSYDLGHAGLQHFL